MRQAEVEALDKELTDCMNAMRQLENRRSDMMRQELQSREAQRLQQQQKDNKQATLRQSQEHQRWSKQHRLSQLQAEKTASSAGPDRMWAYDNWRRRSEQRQHTQTNNNNNASRPTGTSDGHQFMVDDVTLLASPQ